MKIGILALQGAFREHAAAFDALGVETVFVRLPHHLSGIDAIVRPGGESTTQDKLLDSSGLRAPLTAALDDGVACLATCAGLILLAAEVLDGRPDQRPLDRLDLRVRRNGYGRQVASFEAPLAVEGLEAPFTGVFIRAPRIEHVGESVEVLAEHAGDAVLVRAERIWGAVFHPELSADLRLHQLFVNHCP